MNSLSLRNVLHIFFKRKKTILYFGISVFTLIAVGTFLISPKYQASAKILVKPGREDQVTSTSVMRDAPKVVYQFNEDRQKNSEVQILTSRVLIEKVVELLGPTVIFPSLKEDKPGILSTVFSFLPKTTNERFQSDLDIAVKKFEKKLWVGSIKDSSMIKVTFKHKDPELAAKVVNSLVSQYMELHLDIHKRNKTYDFFKKQSELLGKQSQDAENKLEAFKREHGIIDPDEERRLLLHQVAALRSDLNGTLIQESETDKRIRQLRVQLGNTEETVEIGQEVKKNNETISRFETRLVELELKEQEIQNRFTDEVPFKARLVQQVRDEIDMVTRKLKEQETKLDGVVRSGKNQLHEDLQSNLLRNQVELHALKTKKETQMAQLADYRIKLNRFNQLELEFKRLKQEVDINRENYKEYLIKFEESRISNAMDTDRLTNVKVIEPATAPFDPVSPKVLLNLALGFILGGFGSLGLAFCSEFLDDCIETDQDVESLLEMPVLASVSHLEDIKGQ